MPYSAAASTCSSSRNRDDHSLNINNNNRAKLQLMYQTNCKVGCCVYLLLLLISLTTTSAFHFPKSLQQQQRMSTIVSRYNNDEHQLFQHQKLRHLEAALLNDDGYDDEQTQDQNQEVQQQQQQKLGIPIMLNPITIDDVAAIKAEANEVVNDIVASGIDELQLLRQQMNTEFDIMKQQRDIQRQIDSTEAQNKLLNKIDTLTNNFLQQTEQSRTTTKLIAQADQSNAAMGGMKSSIGVEMGTWGIVNGRYVTTTSNIDGNNNNVGLLGSTGSIGDNNNNNNANNPKNQWMIVIADTTSDPYAKLICNKLEESLQGVLSSSSSTSSSKFEMITYTPSSTKIPMGNTYNAPAILVFCTSMNDITTLQTIIDRIFRTTISNSGEVQAPPSQIIAISTIGTSRTDQMPYSFQNMMSNNKLSKRRLMEEYIIRYAQQNGIDYTICLLGNEIKVDGNNKDAFQLVYGDTIVDGSNVISVDTAVSVLTHAIALQPNARNTTFSCTGSIASSSSSSSSLYQPNAIDTILDEAFVVLDGPELIRFDHLASTSSRSSSNSDMDTTFNVLSEYIMEWAELVSSSNKGLTTPVRLDIVPARTTTTSSNNLPYGVVQQSSLIRLLFQPTNTGKYYSSKKDDERMMNERKDGSNNKNLDKSSPIPRSSSAKEGGIEFVVEKVLSSNDNNNPSIDIRVRAKRCNYGTDATIKELSEETLLSQFKKCINVWKKEHL